jgi:hypothetical protein
MRSRINSTGRQKITPAMAAFSVTPRDDGTAEFDADIDLSQLGLPGDGLVVVEAYRQSLHERFPFGTVRLTAAQERTVLRELDPSAVSFRVKVIEPGTGRLLARGDRFSTAETEESGRQELLKVVEKDLGQETWRTEIYDEDRKPVLVLNNHIPDALSRIKSDPQLQAYILPAALRQVLMMLWLERREEDEDDDSHWTTQWIRFAQNLTGEEKPDWTQGPEVTRWIDEVCRVFSSHFAFTDRIIAEAD